MVSAFDFVLNGRAVRASGTSANTSLKGSRYRLEDIEDAVRKISDVEIDYGPSRYENPHGRSSTMIDFSTMRVQRVGVCFAEIAAVLKQQFGVTLTAPAEQAAN